MILLALALLATIPSDGHYVVFDRSRAAVLLRQCSRAAPTIGDAGWTPMAGDISAMEAALPAALGAVRALHPTLASAPYGWIRQYIGIVRDGRRSVYGNYVPNDAGGTQRWRTDPIVVCDGGDSFFGAEYDVVARTFTHLAFNGHV